MSFSRLAEKRYSVRAHEPDPVGEEKLRVVLEAARLAPTAANRQPFRIIVICTGTSFARAQVCLPAGVA